MEGSAKSAALPVSEGRQNAERIEEMGVWQCDDRMEFFHYKQKSFNKAKPSFMTDEHLRIVN
jgi:hypothetical protein